MTDENQEEMRQEVRAVVTLTYWADAGLDAENLRAEIVADVNRLADADSASRAEMCGGKVELIHEERDIAGHDDFLRENPLDVLRNWISGGSLSGEARDAAQKALGSTEDKPSLDDQPEALTLTRAAEIICEQRDYFAEHGSYREQYYRPASDQCFDDWACDLLREAQGGETS